MIRYKLKSEVRGRAKRAEHLLFFTYYLPQTTDFRSQIFKRIPTGQWSEPVISGSIHASSTKEIPS